MFRFHRSVKLTGYKKKSHICVIYQAIATDFVGYSRVRFVCIVHSTKIGIDNGQFVEICQNPKRLKCEVASGKEQISARIYGETNKFAK